MDNRSPHPPADDSKPFRAYVSLGSNIEPETHLEKAIRCINDRWEIERCSHLYRTTPVRMEPGADSVWNLVLELRVGESPSRLKKELKKLENRLDRDRQPESDPSLYVSRKLDADILFYDPLPEDQDPDPETYTEAYVAVPLSELVDVPPGWEGTRADWLETVGQTEIEERLFHPLERWL